MAILSTIETIRDAVTERLRGSGDLSGVEVISRKEGDPESRAMELLGRCGAVVVVIIGSALPKSNQTAMVLLDPVNILVSCGENVPMNQSATGTGKGAMYLAERVTANLQYWSPQMPPDAQCSVIMPTEPGIVEAARSGRHPLIYV